MVTRQPLTLRLLAFQRDYHPVSGNGTISGGAPFTWFWQPTPWAVDDLYITSDPTKVFGSEVSGEDAVPLGYVDPAHPNWYLQGYTARGARANDLPRVPHEMVLADGFRLKSAAGTVSDAQLDELTPLGQPVRAVCTLTRGKFSWTAAAIEIQPGTPVVMELNAVRTGELPPSDAGPGFDNRLTVDTQFLAASPFAADDATYWGLLDGPGPFRHDISTANQWPFAAAISSASDSNYWHGVGLKFAGGDITVALAGVREYTPLVVDVPPTSKLTVGPYQSRYII